MKIVLRLITILIVISLVALPRRASADHARPHLIAQLSRAERQQASMAARLLPRDPGRAVRWLASRPGVATAQLGQDGSTVDIHFRDGHRLVILPPQPTSAVSGSLRSEVRTQAGSGPGKAIVLVPFAGELQEGAAAGQPEMDALTAAGFQVDVLRDADVTVSAMEKLAAYSFVYIETHSGVLPNGDAIVATAETNFAPYAAYSQYGGDGSLMQVCVAVANGTSCDTLYDAITSKFITKHIGAFPANTIWFLNGCSTLAAPAFWDALHSENVTSMISWDNEVYNTVDLKAASVVLGRMVTGDNVAAGIAAALSAGVGTSPTTTGTAHLGFLGDGDNTLQRALTGQPLPTPTPPPSAVPAATPALEPAPYSCPFHWGRLAPACPS